MSRSYKKTPVSICGGRCGGTRKHWKMQANRKVRKERTLRNKSKSYKKIYETWNIRDYRFYERKPNEIDGDWVARWEKYYHRK